MRVVILFFCTVSSLATAQDFSHLHYNIENGLADNRVLSITQDSRGFMWFGLGDGLSRFDGSVFKNYFNIGDSSTLPLHWIDHLVETKPGYLVLITAGCKLVILNTYTGQFYRPSDFINRPVCGVNRISPSRYLLSSEDTCFVADGDMKLVDAVIPDLQNKSGLIIGQSLTDSSCLLSLQNDPTEYYLYRYDVKKLSKLDLGLTPSDANVLRFNFYDSINQWLYFTNFFSGVYRYSLDGKQLKHWPMRNYDFCNFFNDSTLFIGRLDAGAILLNLKNDYKIRLNVNNKIAYDAHTLFKDIEGNFWIGTDIGVTRLKVNQQLVKSWEKFEPQPSAGNYPIRILRGKDQRMYLAFYALPSLYQLDSKNDEWKLFSKNLITGPWCVNPVGDDIIFTGGQTAKFTTFSPLTGKFQHSTDFLKRYFPNSDVLILAFQHSNGDRWYSANKGGGFVRVAATDGAIHHYTKNGARGHFSWSYYSTYAEDDSGDLWFGVNKTGSLLHWDYQTDRFSEVWLDTIPGMKGRIYDVINEVIHDKQNNLWIAFDGGGIVRYDHARQRLTRYTDEDGLPSRFVSSMIFDGKGRLWLTTYTKGISCLLVDENRIRAFTKEDGLKENEFPERCIYYDSIENKVWIGGASSVMRFDPDSLLAQDKKVITVYLDEIYINGKQYPHNPVEKLDLPYEKNNIQLYFSAINMDRKSIHLAYKLEGYDTAWTNSLSGTVAAYANLPPGDYAFAIKASYKGDSRQAYFSKPFTFNIDTPWFQTVWFQIIVIVTFILAVILSVREYYSRKAEKQKLILENKQAVEKERTRIATDMHDDFGAGLSRIKFISEKIKLKSKKESSLSHDLTKISDYSDEMAEKMNEIVWALNERYDSLEDLVSFSRAYAADYLQHHPIKLNFTSNINTNQLVKGEVRRNVYLVIKESLHNIVKHAGATQIEINFQITNRLKVTIRDNGKGFSTNHIRPFANGISNMIKRIEDIGGKFELFSEQGTTIILVVDI